MILIEFTRDMRPWHAGQSYLLPDSTALALLLEGSAKNPRDRFGNPMPTASDPAIVPPPAPDKRGKFRVK